ncbi:SDR family NAD(P)-dependent oxidoreductase [Solimonas terrae]|uniref:SDR family oxidoreductase n=1 Tax=Solimonas terrae TaxID=1396819 RepID=A0A6M2BPI7_9GAMM|nr:SDR family oxidoreductase [Solimonas terrae]NGY03963.1 SDR family oxidoreductase [Solimonas terrae]
MSQRFQGRTVLVTGGAAGLGRSFAEHFAAEGAQLLLLDIDRKGLDETAALLRARGTMCATYRVDLAVEAEIQAFAAQLIAEHPRLDVLVNNAGLAYGEIATGFTDLSQEKWLRYFAINSVAPVLLGQAVRPALAAAKGNVINITSMASYMPATAYGVTKATLASMTYAMATHFSADGIRVNGIAPGIMETPASKDSLPAETYARVQGSQMLKLHGVAEDIARLGLFLASDDARFITSEIVNCDAGNRMRGWRA